MLDHALEVAYRHYDLEQKQAEFHADLMKLPLEELKKVAATGEIKLAFLGEILPENGRPMNWVENFKGTPFFEQAIGLEQEELQAQMSQQQSNSVSSQKSQQEYAQMDQIRLKKRLLELQKARNEAQVLSGGGGPPNQTGSGAGPGAEAQGAGALGPVAPEGQQEGSGDTNKMGSVKEAVSPGWVAEKVRAAAPRTGSREREFVNKMKALGGRSTDKWMAAKKSGNTKAFEHGNAMGEKVHAAVDTAMERKSKTSSVKKAKLEIRGPQTDAELEQYLSPDEKERLKMAAAGADAWGREMARKDMAKVARAREIFATGDALGRSIAKTGGVLGEVGQWALKHPSQAGAVAGGTLGAAHGLMKEDGGVGSALAEGVAGAAAGHAVGGIGSRMAAGKDVGAAASGYATNTKRKLLSLSEKMGRGLTVPKGTLSPAHPPEASLGGGQVQAAQ
jgi:hypothetical protein